MRPLSRTLSLLIIAVTAVLFVGLVVTRVRERAHKLQQLFPRILASELTYYLTQSLGRTVAIGSVRLDGPAHLIEFRNILVDHTPGEVGPPLAVVGRVVVHYDPGFLSLRLFDPMSALGEIDVYQPDVFVLHDAAGEWNILHFGHPSAKKARPSIPLNLSIRVIGGRARYLDLKPLHGDRPAAAAASHVNARVFLQSDGPVRWRGSVEGAPFAMDAQTARKLRIGRTPAQFAHAEVSGVIDVGDPGILIHVDANHASVALILDSYVHLGFVNVTGGLASGRVDLSRTTAGPHPWSYQVRAHVSASAVATKWLQSPVRGVSGALSLSGQTLTFRVDQATYGQATLAGSGILMGFSGPVLNGVFSAQGVTQGLVDEFVKRSARNNFRLMTTASATVSIQGPVLRPAVAARISASEIRIQGLALRDAVVGVSYTNGRGSLTHAAFRIAGGSAAFSGSVDLGAGPAYDVRGYVQDVNPLALPIPTRVRSILRSGLLSGNLHVSGKGSAFSLKASLLMQRIRAILGGSSVAAHLLSGTLSASVLPGGAISASLDVRGRGLGVNSGGERYGLDTAWANVNAHLRGSQLSLLESTGAVSGVHSRLVTLAGATWSIRPGAGHTSQVNVSMRDPSGDLQLAGTASSNLAHFNLQVLGRNLNLASLGTLMPALKPVSGFAYLNGVLKGSVSSPAFQGHIQVLGATYQRDGAAQSPAPGTGSLGSLRRGPPLRFDHISGDMALDSSGLQVSNLTLGLFPGQIVLNGSVAMRQFRPESVQLDVAVTGMSLSRLSALARVDLGLYGVGSADLSVTGTLTHPHVAGTLEVQNADVRGYPVSDAHASFVYAPPSLSGKAKSVDSLMEGLDLRSLSVQSTIGSMTMTGSPIGADGHLKLHADIAGLSLEDIGIPGFVTALESPRLSIDIQGSLRQPELIAQLPALPVNINAQQVMMSASDIVLRPNMKAFQAPASGFPIALLSVGRIRLQRQDETIDLTGPRTGVPAQLIPRLDALVTVSGTSVATLTGLAAVPLPQGASGAVSHASLKVYGDERLPPGQAPTGPASASSMVDRYFRKLSASLSVTLQDVAIEPPTRGVLIPAPLPQQPAPESTRNAAHPSPAPTRPAHAAPPPGLVSAARLDSVTPGPTGAAGAAPAEATAPEISGIHFAVGQIDVRLDDHRITIDTAYLHQFDSVKRPGVRLEVASSPNGPATIVLGGDMDVVLNASTIPISLISQAITAFSLQRPRARTDAMTRVEAALQNLHGDIFVAARASGKANDPVLQVSVDAGSARPLTYGAVPLTASLVATVREGSISLDNLALGTKGHVIRASGSMPFTWAGRIPANAPLQFHAETGQDSIALFQAIAPNVVQSASGSLSADVNVGGTLTAPQVTGSLKAGPGQILLRHFDKPIDDFTVNISFHGTRMQVDVNGVSDRGRISLSGSALLPAGNTPGALDLRLTSRDFHLTDRGALAALASGPADSSDRPQPEMIYAFLQADIKITGTFAQPAVTGSMLLHDADIRLNSVPSAVAGTASAPAINPTFNVTMTVGQPFRYGRDMSVRFTQSVQVKPYGSFTLTGSLAHPIITGDLNVNRGGGYVSYVVGMWRVDRARINIQYAPPVNPSAGSGLTLDMDAVLKADIEEPGTKPVGLFASSGQVLSVTMEVIGDPLVPGRFQVLLSSDPARDQAELRSLVLHTQSMENLGSSGLQAELPGLFNEFVRTTLIGNVLQPLQSRLAGILGLEEVNLEYEFSGPMFLEISKRWFGSVSVRLRRQLSAQSQEYQMYLDYRMLSNLTLSLGLLQRPTYQAESFTLQTFLRF